MSLLSVTGFGVAALVTLKSDWPDVATTSVAVAVLLFGFGSMVDAATFTVSVMTVPASVAAFTVTTTAKDVEEFAAIVGFEHVR